MNWSDVEDAIEQYSGQVVPLRTVAWALRRFRRQEGGDATAKELRALTGCCKSVAYKAIQDLAGPQPESAKHGLRVRESRKSSPRNTDSESVNHGLPPDPPIEERELGSVCVSAHAREPDQDVKTHEASPGTAIRGSLDRLAKARVSPQWYDLAARLMDHWNAAWVEELVRDESLRGQPKGVNYYRPILLRWKDAGGPPSLAPREGPSLPAGGARASPAGPDAHLPPWVREKRRKLAENKAKFDAYLARNPPEPKGEAS